eukprot:1194886-Prorocentrum_minimum.AAC.2
MAGVTAHNTLPLRASAGLSSRAAHRSSSAGNRWAKAPGNHSIRIARKVAVSTRCDAKEGAAQPPISRRQAMQLAGFATLVDSTFIKGAFAEEEEEEGAGAVASSLALNLTEEEKIILEYNQRIAVFNRAPADYPSFIRNGSFPLYPLYPTSPLLVRYSSSSVTIA